MPGTKKSCPCGSGRPYEKCCGVRKVYYSLDQVRWRHAGQELRRKLGEFADQPSFAWDAARAQDMYLGCIDQQLVVQDDDFTMERCFEWFIFDYYISSGLTIIETFWEDYPYPLSDYENILVKEWALSRISLYEVNGVIPAEGLIIKDLLSRKKLKVRDINAAADIKTGSILLMRVLKVGEEYEFSTSGLALPDWCKEPLLKRLQQDRRQYYNDKMTSIRGWGAYLKERAHKINAWVMEFGTSNPPCRSNFTERMQYRTVFAINNWQELLEYLKKTDSFILIQDLRDRSGTFQQAVAAWLGEPRLRNGSDESKKEGLRRVLGSLTLMPRFVMITADSPGLLSQGKKFLMAKFKELVEESVDGFPCLWATPADVIEDYSWPAPGYAAVARRVREGFQSLGYSTKQQKGAMKLWLDFCSKEQPSVRNPAVWAAAVIYTFARLEMEEGLKQQDLAGQFGVAPSTVSIKFRLLCRSLDLVAFDRRYSTKKPPVKGRRKNEPRLLDNPRL
ncbi:MAG: hypothetical protein A4E55_01184 [Pelotomaculum sp. PtaU1.Bin035]|nr:MAG: hypothetical protein A4E55_01184 [Pelotomaculum sp. PtaU1.Bin035]